MNTDNSIPSFDAPPTVSPMNGVPMSGNPWPQPIQPVTAPQPTSPRKTRGLLLGGAAAAAALAVGLGAGYYLGNDNEDSAPSQVATYAGDLAEINSVLGSFGQEETLPASFASSLVQCEQGRIVQGQGNPETDSARCTMVLNGYRGEMVYTQDSDWITDMRGDREELRDFQALDITGLDAFTYIERMAGADFPVIVLVDPEGDFYLGVSPRGLEEVMAPTSDESSGFTAAVVESLRV